MLTTVRRYIGIYKVLIKCFLLSRLSYKGDFIIGTISFLMPTALGIIVLNIIFSSIVELKGWSYHELVFLYGFVILTYTPTSLFAEHLWSLGTDIVSGNITRYLLRPINPLFYFLSQSINVNAISQAVIGLVLMYYAIRTGDLQINLAYLPIYLLLYLSSAAIAFSLFLLSSAVGFWISLPNAAMALFSKVKDISNYPIDIFSGNIKNFFIWVLPLGFIGHYPAGIILNKVDSLFIILACPIVAVISLYLSCKFWLYGINLNNSTGS